MRVLQPTCGLTALLAILIALPSTSAAADDDDGIAFFEEHIRPVLVEYCYECHGADSDEPAGGLRLDHREGMRSGGELGPAVVPEDIDESLIISALRYQDLEMPPDEMLDDDIIEKFEEWIRMGAPDPREEDGSTPAPDVEHEAEPLLWSLQPVTSPQPPRVQNSAWPANEIDQFVLSRLEQQGLQPAPDASPTALVRRLSYALRGLPPSVEAVNSAAGMQPEDVIAAFTDQWLGSSQFGERWGRHWLDVVRYGESAGSSRDVLMLYSWRYRDYVIDALNDDIPWDQFIREQIAGDLLPAETDEERSRKLIATGLLALGSKSLNGGNLPLDIADDQIDVISKSVMGLTVSCARCHDHKFDPIPTRDYYALAGIFRSTTTYYGGGTNRPKNRKDKSAIYYRLDEPDATESASDQKTAARIKQLQRLVARLQKQTQGKRPNTQELKQELARTRRELATLQREQNDDSHAEYAFVAVDQQKPKDWPLQVRGDKGQNGPVVPRGFLSCVELPDVPAIGDSESGRRQLAEWLTSPEHPLTSRVIVNRIWHHLFGRGLVATVDNFGRMGDTPSHPALLDWLAHRFVHHHRWSIKSLIREILASRTWRQSTHFSQTNWEADPDNVLLWRSRRRRLEAEAIRDAMLTMSGTLDLQRPAGSLVQQIGEGEVGRNIRTDVLDKPSPYRSVYLPIIRGLLPEMLKVFDFPEPSNPQGRRTVTNVPTQALYLMNSPFVIEQARLFAKRLLEEEQDDNARLQLAWQMALGRRPDADELQLANDALKTARSTSEEDLMSAWTQICHALLASAEFRFID